MPPRRGGGRRTRRSEEESRAGSDDDAQVEDVTRQIGGMELVLARFQRTNPPTLTGTEGGSRAEAWLVQMEELFDTLEYAPEKRLKLAVLQLRDDAQRWWRSTSRMLRDSGTVLSWDLLLVDIARSVRLSGEVTRVSQRFGMLTIEFSRCVCEERSADGLRAADRYDDVGVTYYLLLVVVALVAAEFYVEEKRVAADCLLLISLIDWYESADIARSVRLSGEVTRVSQRFGMLTIEFSRCVCEERSADGLRAADRYDDVGVTYYLLLVVVALVAAEFYEEEKRVAADCLLLISLIDWYESAVVSEKSNAIVGVVTTGFECLPPSCDGLTGPDDHGPMISWLIDRGVSGNQAGPSGSSVGRSPHP
ncbi:hypothetical protein F511_17146 [Dorcoceras hygrometricum]|uniref:Uncharacterized protein n=1 Tax=Dorcoceras hygrometricum TaxID=472368 RepID=A0A2Z7C4Z2_9LAMI|nr:hypothetical protein F511_17146 [Dorcoceras hygrometricum]